MQFRQIWEHNHLPLGMLSCSEEPTTQNHLVWPLSSTSLCFRLRLITRRAEQQLDFHFHQPVLIYSTSKSTITALQSARKWKLLFPFDISEGPQGEKTKSSRQEFCQYVITGLPILMRMKDQYKLPVTQWNTTQGYCRLEHSTNADFKNKIK